MKTTDRSEECNPSSTTNSPQRASQSSTGQAISTVAGSAAQFSQRSARYRDTSDMRARLTSNHFVGRVGELAELELALRESTSHRPVLVLLGGESGVGKTRRVAEFERRLADEALVLRGEAVEQGDGELPYAP